MFVLGNLLIGIAQVLNTVIYAYIFILVLDSVLSFIPTMGYSPIRQFFRNLSGLMLNPLRKFIKPIGNVDLTPFIAILILIFVNSFLVQSLFDLGRTLR